LVRTYWCVVYVLGSVQAWLRPVCCAWCQCFKLEERAGYWLAHAPHYNPFIVIVFIAWRQAIIEIYQSTNEYTYNENKRAAEVGSKWIVVNLIKKDDNWWWWWWLMDFLDILWIPFYLYYIFILIINWGQHSSVNVHVKGDPKTSSCCGRITICFPSFSIFSLIPSLLMNIYIL